MNTATFMSTYWQKKPCLFKGALTQQIATLPDENELAGFALEEQVESRLILGSPGLSPPSELSLLHGPFKPEILTNLPETNWTLLLQSMDLWEPKFMQCLNWVNFIPRWRLDDVMVSIAAKGGGVGPHRDHYDVFLIQTLGDKRWRLAPPSETQDIEVIDDLLLVENFQPDFDQIVTAGDVLYLPPGWLHWGIAETLAITCSIGFRAPDLDAILQQLLSEISANTALNHRYSDPWRTPTPSMRVTDKDVDELSKMFMTLAENRSLLQHLLAKQVTWPRADININVEDQKPVHYIADLILENKKITLAESARLTYTVSADPAVHVYLNGEDFILAPIDPDHSQMLYQFLDSLAKHENIVLNHRQNHLACFQLLRYISDEQSLIVLS